MVRRQPRAKDAKNRLRDQADRRSFSGKPSDSADKFYGVLNEMGRDRCLSVQTNLMGC